MVDESGKVLTCRGFLF